MEIERKFLIDDFPDLPLLEEAQVYQGYLSVDPVVRIRSKDTDAGTDFKLCIKGKGSIARTEVEIPITQGQFEELKGLLKAEMVHKDYKVYALPGGRRLECSRVDEGSPTEFLYAEVEFTSLEEALSFPMPPFLLQDVTEDPYYKMNQYWQRKLKQRKEDTSRSVRKIP